jgi:hypothetical protein
MSSYESAALAIAAARRNILNAKGYMADEITTMSEQAVNVYDILNQVDSNLLMLESMCVAIAKAEGETK